MNLVTRITEPSAVSKTDSLNNFDHDARLLIKTLQHSFPTHPEGKPERWLVPPLNVLDCVLSLNRNYDNFCEPRVKRFQEQNPEVDSLARLLRLINTYPTPLEFSIKELNYRDEKRAATLVGVLIYLLKVQTDYEGSSETSRLTEWANLAQSCDYERLEIRGFGLSGFQYLRMLFGAQTVKPDLHICRFVAKAVGHAVSDTQALALLEVAGKDLGWPLSALDYAIWGQRARGAVGAPPPLVCGGLVSSTPAKGPSLKFNPH